MRLAFFGTSEFAVPALHALSQHVELVVSRPDRPTGRGRAMRSSPVKLAAQALGTHVEAPESARDPAFVELIASGCFDALVVASYGQILTMALLEAATRGGINIHASLLPKYRGAAPIQRAILDGETETGVTLMQMDKGMDTGPVIASSRMTIGPDETSSQLEARLAEAGAVLVAEWMPKIVAGDYSAIPQDHRLATTAPKIERADARLVTSSDADSSYRRFRASTTKPGAYIETRFGELKLLEVSPSSDSGLPGTVARRPSGIHLFFAEGSLVLRRVRLEGRGAWSGEDMMNGLRLANADSLA